MTSATRTPALTPRRAARPAAAAPTPRAALGLLRQAGEGLAEAHRRGRAADALPGGLPRRAAGGCRGARPARPAGAAPRRAADVWHLLADVAPELGEWAAFFASCSDTRAAAEAGIARLVSRRDADDLLRQAEQFVGLVVRARRGPLSGRCSCRGRPRPAPSRRSHG